MQQMVKLCIYEEEVFIVSHIYSVFHSQTKLFERIDPRAVHKSEGRDNKSDGTASKLCAKICKPC